MEKHDDPERVAALGFERRRVRGDGTVLSPGSETCFQAEVVGGIGGRRLGAQAGQMLEHAQELKARIGGKFSPGRRGRRPRGKRESQEGRGKSEKRGDARGGSHGAHSLQF